MISVMSDDIIDVLRSLSRASRSLGASEYLFHLGDPIVALFVVLDGEVRLVRHRDDGGAIILQRARPGEVLAEASLFSDRYHCDAVAATNAVVLSIPKRKIRDLFRNEPAFAEAWAAHLAREIQNTRFRSEVLSLRTVAARLSAWLAWHGELPPKGEWKRLAQEIGVSAEALYREIARRQS